MTDSKEGKIIILFYILLSVLVLLIYSQTAGFDFVNYDDYLYTLDNPTAQNGLTWEGVKYAFTGATLVSNYWIPLVWLSFMADFSIWGVNAGGFHCTNLVLHLANVLLLFTALRMLTGRKYESAFVAALFAAHPIHVESVAWVAERKDLLCGFFFMLSLIAYARYAKNPSWQKYILVLVLFVLGLMSKPMLVTFPFLLLLLDHWPLSRMGRGWKSFRALAVEKIPFLLLTPLVSAGAIVYQKKGGAWVSMDSIPWSLRLLNTLISYATYLRKMVIPTDLAVCYPYPATAPALQWMGALFLLLAISLVALKYIKKAPWLFTGWFWFCGVLFPVSGIFIIGDYLVADRYAYLTFIGLYLAVAVSFGEFLKISAVNKKAVALASAAIICGLGFSAWMQTGYWKNGATLFSHTIFVTGPGNYTAQLNLGNALARMGLYDDALMHLMKAHELNTGRAEPVNSIGGVYLAAGKTDPAIQLFRAALKIRPDYPDAARNLSIALKEKAKQNQSIEPTTAGPFPLSRR